MLLQCASVLALMVASVLGDVYFHNPRGSNNRLNEQSAERANANRLFDSQVCTLQLRIVWMCLFQYIYVECNI